MAETAFEAARQRLGMSTAEAVDHDTLLARLEQALWADPSRELERLYQACCREAAARERAVAHRLVVVVPVADRPRQLRHCLESLAEHQRGFAHAGGVSLVVVEDSLDPANRRAHADLVREIAAAGLDAHYLDTAAQWALIEPLQATLPLFLGRQRAEAMGHKGASVTRNIAMLWLARQGFTRPLFHFIDSDQVFHVDPFAARPRYLLDHARHIDRLFRTHDIEVLTGKVVGDPPVSPAVMAGTLLQDLNGILESALPAPGAACGFHGETAGAGHGAYHDMAALFGLDAAAQTFEYACPLDGAHTHVDTLQALGERLSRFFDGEHPTRVTPFSPVDVETSLSPARTVYTGNYVFNRAGLRHGIPFAALKLRMAGPTLGRLLQQELGERFVQAALPLLHRRAEPQTGSAEYRPGVRYEGALVELSGEYQRQFVGDLMLFGIIELVGAGYPAHLPKGDCVEALFDNVGERLLGEYRQVREQVMERLATFERRLDGHHRVEDNLFEPYRHFARLVRHNYAPQAAAVRALEDPAFRADWIRRLAVAVRELPAQQARWAEIVG